MGILKNGHINPVRPYFCNKVLPLAYDDSLSYYEVLGKLTHSMNEIIDAINTDFASVIEEKIGLYFNDIMINAIYDANNHRVILKTEELVASGDKHIYNVNDQTMTIE